MRMARRTRVDRVFRLRKKDHDRRHANREPNDCSVSLGVSVRARAAPLVLKVIAVSELMRTEGTVAKALSKWLAEKGYVIAAKGREGAERGAAAALELPQAQALARNLIAGDAS